MDLALSETQQLLRDAVRDYLAREVSFDRVREVQRSGSYDQQLWQALHELGWLGLALPEDAGGGGGSLTDLAVLLEELSRRAVMIPFMEAMVAARALLQSVERNVTQPLISALAAGGAIVVPAFAETTGATEDVRAEIREGNRLYGEKWYVDYGQAATHHLVAARRDSEVALVVVDTRDPGVHMEPLHAISRTPQAKVRYDGAAAMPIGGNVQYEESVQYGRALAAIQCLGYAQQGLDMTVAYVSDRVQFGQAIGSFQAVQHHCANMATLVTATRFLAYEAVWALDHGVATARQVAIAKATSSRTVTEVTMMAHQLHGGIGIVEEYDLHFFSLRGKERALAWGSAEECLAIIAGELDEAEDWLPMKPAVIASAVAAE